MGEVIGGRHVRLDRQVAIKRLPAAFARDEEVRERFGEEARVLASLNHPHIVPVYDYIEQDGLCLLVMEALPKGTVWDRFTGEGLTLRTSCAVVLTTCEALSYAHEHRVLHRDIKPENLMFDDEDSLKVTDFGIAKVLGGDETLATVDGAVIGTPAYMAPEQAAGQSVGPQADVYAVATMFYELASARLPFDESGGASGILEARITNDPIPLQDVAPQVPEALARVIMEGLARDPGDRPASAAAFGVNVVVAANAAWGPDWIAEAGLKLMASGAIARSTQRHPVGTPTTETDSAVGSAPSATAGGTRTTGDPAGADVEAHETRMRGDAAGADVEAHETRMRGDAAGADVEAHETRMRGDAAGADVEAHETRMRGDAAGADVEAHETRMRGDAAGADVEAPEADVVMSSEVVTGKARDDSVHRAGDLGDIDPADFVPLHEVLSPPAVPYAAIAATCAAVLLFLVISLVGLGSPSRDGDFTEGQVLLEGQDIAAGETVTADLAEQVVVDIVDLPAEAGDARFVELRLSAAGLPLGASTAGVLPPGGEGTTDFGVRSLRVITGGELTSDLRFLDANGDLVDHQEFGLDVDQPWYQTAAALGGLTLLLFVTAYAISVAAPLWLGRRRRSAGIALTWLGGIAGLTIQAIFWALGGPEPTLLSMIVVAALGAASGAAGSWSLFRMRRRHRLLEAGAVKDPLERAQLDDVETEEKVKAGSSS